MLTEKVFITDEFSMNYGEGPKTGPPLVFLHGATLWWRTFEPLIQPLSQNWHIYACNMRGHGISSRTPGKYRAVDFTPDIIDFVQKQVQEPVIFVGHSAGGIYALLVAAQIPEMVQGIVLLDPATALHNTLVEAMPGPWGWFIGVGDVLASRRSARDFLLEGNPEIDEAELQNVESMIRSVDPEFVSILLKNKFFDGLDLEQVLAKITCPTLLLYGDLALGSVVSEAEVMFIKQHIPQITAVHINGAGHDPHWEQTEATLGYIHDFLNGV
jgi:pimeloyl-ACP methyl ester carboxylesterase